MEDKKFTCCDCKKEFVWTVKEQQFFKDNKIDKEPVRCRDCAIILRNKRKKDKEKEEENKKQEKKEDNQSAVKEEAKTNKKSKKSSES